METLPEVQKISVFRFIVLSMLGEEKGMLCLQEIASKLGHEKLALRKDLSPATFNWKHEDDKEYGKSDALASILCKYNEELAFCIGRIFNDHYITVPYNLSAPRALVREAHDWETLPEDTINFSDDPDLNRIFNERLDDKINKSATSSEQRKKNRIYAKALIGQFVETVPDERRKVATDQLVRYAMTCFLADKMIEDSFGKDVTAGMITAANKLSETMLEVIEALRPDNDPNKGKKGIGGLLSSVKNSSEPGVKCDINKLRKSAK